MLCEGCDGTCHWVTVAQKEKTVQPGRYLPQKVCLLTPLPCA